MHRLPSRYCHPAFLSDHKLFVRFQSIQLFSPLPTANKSRIKSRRTDIAIFIGKHLEYKREKCSIVTNIQQVWEQELSLKYNVRWVSMSSMTYNRGRCPLCFTVVDGEMVCSRVHAESQQPPAVLPDQGLLRPPGLACLAPGNLWGFRQRHHAQEWVTASCF